MKILVINCGSSSLKYQLIDMDGEKLIAKGICEYLKFMGVKIDDERNKVKSEEALISTDDSSIPVWVIPTNEELVIARDTLRLVTK